MKTKIWKNGTVHATADQCCDLCHTRIKPIFIDTPNDPDTWFWRECGTCDSMVCGKCSDSNDQGEVICLKCELERVKPINNILK